MARPLGGRSGIRVQVSDLDIDTVGRRIFFAALYQIDQSDSGARPFVAGVIVQMIGSWFVMAALGWICLRQIHQGRVQNFTRRSRSAFSTTDSDEALIAKAAKIGPTRMPKNG